MRPTEFEKAEYAAGLVAIGAVPEAISILDGLDSKLNPQVLLYRAFALITRWDYAATISPLEKFIASPGLSPYQKLVGKVNLAAALTFEREASAGEVLAELLGETKREGLFRLHGNALELRAQLAIQDGEWSKARRCLEEAKVALKETGGLDEFFVRKWSAVHRVLSEKSAGAFSELESIRSEAKERHHWETVRDCDRIRAIARREKEVFLHVYFGTPYESFRARALEEAGWTASLPDSYRWELKPSGRPGKAWNLLDTSERPDLDGIPRRLLDLLCRDFYRPVRLASLYAHLYPHEYFNPLSSPNRVHQAVKRLKHWFTENRVPLTIEENASAYRLQATRGCALEIPLERTEQSQRESRIAELRRRYSSRPFAAKEASRELNLPLRTANRLLRDAEEQGKLIRIGASSSTRFSFPQN